MTDQKKKTPTKTIRQASGTPGTGFGFGYALGYLEGGHYLRRMGWNGKEQWIVLQRPDANSKMTAPYIYIETLSGVRVPWLASQTDLLAKDWECVVVEDVQPPEPAFIFAVGDIVKLKDPKRVTFCGGRRDRQQESDIPANWRPLENRKFVVVEPLDRDGDVSVAPAGTTAGDPAHRWVAATDLVLVCKA